MLMLERVFGVTDTDAATILLATRLACPSGIRPPFLCVETAWRGVDPCNCWVSYGYPTVALDGVRSMRPRAINSFVTKWTFYQRQNAPLLLDCFVERPPKRLHANARRTWYMLEQGLIHLRTANPTTRIVSPQDRIRLRDAARQVLDDSWRGKMGPPPIMPQSWARKLTVLMKLAPQLNAWDDLCHNFSVMATLLPRLRGETKPNRNDWRMLDRLLADSVPHWTMQMLGLIDSAGEKGLTSQQFAKLPKPPARPDEWQSDRFMARELIRLKRLGYVGYNRQSKRWTVLDEDVLGLIRLAKA
jgi:hypothetical protein